METHRFISPGSPLWCRPSEEKGTTPTMHPIKRTLALLLTLSLSVSCLPGAALAVEEPAPSVSPSSTPVVVDEEETPAVTAETSEEAAPAEDTPEDTKAADADTAETLIDSLPERTPVAGNIPTTDAEVQEALDTFDPTIDDPQYLKEYARQQEAAQDDGIATFAAGSNPYTGKTFTHTHAKTKYIYYGIDVSQWQGTVDWSKVKAAGISFVFIRSSYTSISKFTMYTDPKFKTNLNGALAAGLKVGIYHYSGATSATEAKKEANYVLNLLKPYKSSITLPVMFDYETTQRSDDRIYNNYKKTSKATRDKYVTTFCNAAIAAGYSSGLYSNPGWINVFFNSSKFSSYTNWIAHWTTKTSYTGSYDFWQYAGDNAIIGKVNGVKGNVDCNFWYTNTKIAGAITANGAFTGDTTPKAEAASTALTTPYVTTSSVNYRMAPGTSGTKAGTLSKGTVIDLVYGYHKTVSGEKWYKFNYNGHAYYIHEDYVDREVLQNHTAAKDLSYHASASTSATAKGTFSNGSKVQVVQGGSQTADGAQWHKVKVGSNYYYAAAEHLTPAETFVASSAKKNVNVRTKAGTDQKKATYIYTGTPVTVVNGKAVAVSGERWEQVKIGSKYYYILGSYLTKASSSKALTASNTTVVLKYTSTPYTGKALKPSVTVTYNGKTLVNGTDYAVTYSSNKEPGTATVKVTGQGSYSGSLSKTFQITALTASYVTTAKINYRSGAGTKYASKGKVAKGKPVEVVFGWSQTVSGQKWYKVKISGKYYYMMGKYLTQETRVKYTTTAKVTYRSGAGTKYASKGTLAKGSTAQIVKGWSKKANGYTWYKLRIKNSYYYLPSSSLKKAESVTLYTTKAKVNVRSGAGTNYAVVASLAAKTPVAVIGGGQKMVGDETWQMVKINTKYYYILGSYLQK